MGQSEGKTGEKTFTRRDFLKSSAAVSAAALATKVSGSGAYAAGSDKIRVGLIGCGGRGSRDTVNCVNSTDGVELYAMGDLFRTNKGIGKRRCLEPTYEYFKKSISDKMNVPESRRFVGWDAYKKVLETDCNVVILTTPPHFRPMMYRAAIEAGKNVFMEKPVAVDPWGCRHVIETSKMADEKGLAVVAGTQMRHRPDYIGVMKRIHDGDIGELLAAQAYYNVGGLWQAERQPDMSDVEWQIRNWYYFNWLSGDHIVEQDVHKIDILNWAFGGPPKKALAMGGRQVRTGEKYGNIYDHFTVEYVYENGASAMNMCRQIPGSSHRLGEQFVGTKGKAVSTGAYGLKIVGENPWEHKGDMRSPSVQEHDDMITSIRKGEPLNDGVRVANSTLTAIMGRMSAYTGMELSWNWIRNESKLKLGPDTYEFGDFKPRPVAMPGQTELV